jgi:hypothetical protein
MLALRLAPKYLESCYPILAGAVALQPGHA